MAQEEKEKESEEQPVDKGGGERIEVLEAVGTERIEIEEDIPCSLLSASLPRRAGKFQSPRCSVK